MGANETPELLDSLADFTPKPASALVRSIAYSRIRNRTKMAFDVFNVSAFGYGVFGSLDRFTRVGGQRVERLSTIEKRCR